MQSNFFLSIEAIETSINKIESNPQGFIFTFQDPSRLNFQNC